MRKHCLAVVLLTSLCATPAAGQEKSVTTVPSEKAAAQAPPSTPVQARVTVVISRQAGDRKISSMPYVFGVTSGERTNLRMGSEVPIGSRSSEGKNVFPASVSYRSIGTNIDCILNATGPGLYRVQFVLEDSSVHLDPEQKSNYPAVTSEYPSFRTFKTNFIALLRDGQTMQHTSATDPVSGEVMKVDVTLNVLK